MTIANARMYSVNTSVREDWKEVLRWVLARAQLSWDVIDYDAPAPLNALWARDDLGLAMMCGLPYSLRTPKPVLLAAPVPSPAKFGGLPRYFSDIVVLTNSPFRNLEDTFGGVVGYTLVDSMSGGVAFRNHLAPFHATAAARGERLYRAAVDELIHARGVIEALVAGRIDIGPLDAYYHALLAHHEPAFAAQVRVIATTAPTPIPPLVATAPLTADEVARLQDALLAVGAAPELHPFRERLLLAGFARLRPADYDVLAEISRRPVPAFEEL